MERSFDPGPSTSAWIPNRKRQPAPPKNPPSPKRTRGLFDSVVRSIRKYFGTRPYDDDDDPVDGTEDEEIEESGDGDDRAIQVIYENAVRRDSIDSNRITSFGINEETRDKSTYTLAREKAGDCADDDEEANVGEKIIMEQHRRKSKYCAHQTETDRILHDTAVRATQERTADLESEEGIGENECEIVYTSPTKSCPSHPVSPLLSAISTPDGQLRLLQFFSEEYPLRQFSMPPDVLGGEESPRPEDSVSRQITPRYEHIVKRGDKWRRWKKDPLHKTRQQQAVERENGRSRNNSVRTNTTNVDKSYDRTSFTAYDNLLNALSMQTTVNVVGNPFAPSSTYSSHLSTSQNERLQRRSKTLEEKKKKILETLDAMLPTRKANNEFHDVDVLDQDVRATSNQMMDSKISRKSGSGSSPSSHPNSDKSSYTASANGSIISSAAFDELSARIQDIHLRKGIVDLSHESYLKGRADSIVREKLLVEELTYREKARLEKERLKQYDIRKKLELEGLYIPHPEKKENEFLELRPESVEIIQRVWAHGNPKDTFEGCNLTRNDFDTLKGLNWLNDEIMNGYLDLVCKRSRENGSLPKVHTFNTFFYQNISTRGYASVKRWTRQIDVFSFDIILVPIHLSVHWCMAVIDMREKRIDYYDSMGKDNDRCIQLLTTYLQEESMDKRKQPFDLTGWEYHQRKDIPRQSNGSDCGVFALKFGDFGARRKDIEFGQEHMQYYRKRMVIQLREGNLAAH